MISFDKVVSFLAPHVCISCGSEGSVLCTNCVEAYHEPLQSRCAGCRRLMNNSKTCSSCKSWLPLQNVYVATAYEGANEQLVRAFKFSVRRQAAEAISQMMAISLESANSYDVLCPIPTAPARIRARGFDHAKLLSHELSERVGVPTEQLLRRTTNARQVGASRAERIRQMAQEFEVSTTKDVVGKHVLLVDDVFTTGATLSAAAQVLKKAGARSVSALVFAQK